MREFLWRWSFWIVGVAAGTVAAAFCGRLRKLLEPLFDPIIAWMASRIPWHRRLHKVRDLLTAEPKKTDKPEATTMKATPQPPSSSQQPAGQYRLTECGIPVPLFTTEPHQAELIPLPCRWRWKADSIVNFQTHCPSCKAALVVEGDRTTAPPGFYTKLACSKCHWTRRFTGSPDELTRALVQFLYGLHRERGLL